MQTASSSVWAACWQMAWAAQMEALNKPPAARGHGEIILYAVPGKEGFYRKLGFERMTTAMAIFDDQAGAAARGYINET